MDVEVEKRKKNWGARVVDDLMLSFLFVVMRAGLDICASEFIEFAATLIIFKDKFSLVSGIY